ncbi:MAG: potassium channel family protein [Candidatus Nanopelagicales bacterium]
MKHQDPYVPSPREQHWSEVMRLPLDVLAWVFLADFVLIWSLPDAPPPVPQLLDGVSWLVWAVFAVDYVVRLTLATSKRSFVKHHKLDLLMVLIPMLRLLRLVVLVRRSLSGVTTEKIAGSIFSIVVVVVMVGAWLVWMVERNAPGATITTFREAVWWAAVTTTTVGYGDYTPVTALGRVIAVVVMVVGIGLIGTVSATVAAWFVTRRGAGKDGKVDDVDGDAGAAAAGDNRDELVRRLDSLAAEQAEIRRLLERLQPPARA